MLPFLALMIPCDGFNAIFSGKAPLAAPEKKPFGKQCMTFFPHMGQDDEA